MGGSSKIWMMDQNLNQPPWHINNEQSLGENEMEIIFSLKKFFYQFWSLSDIRMCISHFAYTGQLTSNLDIVILSVRP